MHPWLPFLFDAAVKGTLILGLAGVTTAYLRRGSAASRHLVWHLAVIAVLAIPVVSVVLPQSLRWPVIPRIGIARIVDPVRTPEPSRDDGLVSESSVGSVEAPAAAAMPGTTAPQEHAAARPVRSVSLATILFAIWAAGALVVLLRYAVGTVVVHWFTRRAETLNAISWASLNETMSFAVGLGHPVRLLKSARAATPMTFGVLDPVVLLPADADEWPEERRRVVLLHELAHVQRLDSLTNIYATVACAVYWFNPLVWVAVRRMRAEGERACDDWVIRAGMRASTYAEHLLDMVKTIGRLHTPVAALPMAQRSTFEGRLLAILEPDMNRNGTRRGQAVMLAGIIALVVLPLAAMTTPAAATAAASDAEEAVEKDEASIPVGSVLARLSARLQGPTSTKRAPTPPAAASRQRPDAVAPAAQVGEWGSSAVSANTMNALITALTDSDLEVRRSTIRTLGELGDPRAVAALSAALRTDKDPAVRRAAAWALGQIGDARAVPALSEAMRGDSDLEVRRTSVWAAGQIGSEASVDALAAVLRDADKELRSTAVWALGQIGEDSAVPALATTLRDADAGIRDQSAWALGQIGANAGVQPLAAALRDSDASVRKTAVWALGQIGEDDAVEPLLGLLDDADANVRSQAVWALGQIGSERSVDGLGRVLRDDKAVAVREKAAWAIGQIGPDRAPQGLIDALHDSDVSVRRTAGWALGQFRDGNSATALRAAMKDSDAQVKRYAMRALARLGDETAYAALAEMLKDPDPAVRKQAAAALGGNDGGWIEPRPHPQPRPAPRPRPRGW
jgi:HEAT repeat protein/beta-lactamase regulating signal transducer with metallopeptidase domain